MVRGRPTGGRGDLKTHRWTQTRKTILQRDGYECQIQGPKCVGRANEVDHIIPKAWGGDENYDNLRAACKPCNAAAGARQRNKAGGPSLTSAPDPRLPSLISLSEPHKAATRRRTHREVPE